MKSTLYAACLLMLGGVVAGCGSDSSTTAVVQTPEQTAILEVNHTLLKGIISRVDQIRFTGYQGQNQVYGPETVGKAAVIRLTLPARTTRLHMDYLAGGAVVGTRDESLNLTAGQTTSLPDGEIVYAAPLTTVDRSIVTTGSGQYKTLTYGPGWSRVVRNDLAQPQAGRETRRQPLFCMPHFSDVHIIDEESPLRIEFLRAIKAPLLPKDDFQAAWRPQETMTRQVAEAMVQRVNAQQNGPVTGRPFDCAVFTGDNGDNRHRVELQNFLTLIDGGPITPSTGNPNLYEGVQDAVTPFLTEYWHPEPGPTDTYKSTLGFPTIPGLLAAVVTPFRATGLKTPWYSCYGNHDHLIQGNFPVKADVEPKNALANIATSSQKLLEVPKGFDALGPSLGVDIFLAVFLDPLGLGQGVDWPTFINEWTSSKNLQRTVTADQNRTLLDKKTYAQAHLDTGAIPGPVGHGFTPSNAQTGNLYYTFEPAPGVLGITLDTTNPGGLDNGSIDLPQVEWMENAIQQVSSRYYDRNGNLVTTGRPDKLVVLYSHHSIESLTNLLPDPTNPVARMLGAEFEGVLHRYPNVVLWMNGHTHYNRVFSHADPSGKTGGFWEIMSPSLIDFPQQVRIVELVDNKDGTLSAFATLLDHAAPPETTTPGDPISLAGISRELSANDPQILNQPGGLDFQIGTPGDRNVELLVKKPF